jgi:hypothetical protein
MENRTARSGLTRSLEAAIFQAQGIGRAVREIATIVIDTQDSALRQAMGAVGLRGLPRPSLAKASSCGLPSCECPSTDLGEIRKVIDQPRPVSLAFRVRNTTKERRVFTLSAKPVMSEEGNPGGSIALVPATVDLDPGEVQMVRAQIDATGHEVGLGYNSIVTIATRNCEDMYLGVSVFVEREIDCAPLVNLHCCCHPRLRPLRWYHHYYCDPQQQQQQQQPQPTHADHAATNLQRTADFDADAPVTGAPEEAAPTDAGGGDNPQSSPGEGEDR